MSTPRPELTPEQAEELGKTLRDVTAAWRRILAALAPVVREACRAVALASEAHQRARIPDRPAWQSPYGPPQKGARR